MKGRHTWKLTPLFILVFLLLRTSLTYGIEPDYSVLGVEVDDTFTFNVRKIYSNQTDSDLVGFYLGMYQNTSERYMAQEGETFTININTINPPVLRGEINRSIFYISCEIKLQNNEIVIRSIELDEQLGDLITSVDWDAQQTALEKQEENAINFYNFSRFEMEITETEDEFQYAYDILDVRNNTKGDIIYLSSSKGEIRYEKSNGVLLYLHDTNTLYSGFGEAVEGGATIKRVGYGESTDFSLPVFNFTITFLSLYIFVILVTKKELINK